MPDNTEKIRDAKFSASLYSLLLIGTAILNLVIRRYFSLTGFWGILLVVSAVLDLGLIIPIHISLKERLKEIEGGEENAAAQY